MFFTLSGGTGDDDDDKQHQDNVDDDNYDDNYDMQGQRSSNFGITDTKVSCTH